MVAGFLVIEEGTGAGVYTIEGGSNGGGLYEFIVGTGIGAPLIASGLIVGQAFSALMLSTFGLGLLIFSSLSVVLLALIFLVAYLRHFGRLMRHGRYLMYFVVNDFLCFLSLLN